MEPVRRPTLFEVQTFNAAAPMFLAWAAPASDVRVLYTPDVVLAVDRPGRRGYLIDDVYLAWPWIADGVDDLVRALHEARVDMVPTLGGDNDVHRAVFELTIRDGRPSRSGS